MSHPKPASKEGIPARALKRLAIFPLPNTVFFPHTILPLHIFEPRYRQMTREAIANGTPIAVVLAHPEGRLDAEGRPAVYPIAGAGLLVDHEQLPDGRFNILLHGVGRIRIVRELETAKPFRQVEAAWIHEVKPPPDEAEVSLGTLRNTIMTLHRLHAEIGTPLVKMAWNVDDADALVDIMASILFPEIELRQGLLEEPRFTRRYAAILGRITDLLVESAEPESGGPTN